jgi:predicted dehydrogenase
VHSRGPKAALLREKANIMAERKEVRVGVIGHGGRMRGLVNQLVAADERVTIQAVYDPDPGAVEQARRHNPELTAYEDYKPLVRDESLDWVMVGSLNCQHREHVVAAFKAGKHVFCEKPLATTLKDCLAMRKARDEAGKHFVIGFTLRYSPHYRTVRELVADGYVGEIISFEFNETLNFNHGGYIHQDWRRRTDWAGTHLLEKCCHDIDIANWITGRQARRAASFGGCDFFVPKNTKHQKRLGSDPESGTPAYQSFWRQSGSNPFTVKDKDIVDNQVAILEYDNAVRATFHTNCNAGLPERRMYICGSEGSLRADVIAGSIVGQRIGFETKTEEFSTDARGGHGGGDSVLVRSLADCMFKNKKPVTTLEDGLKAAVTCFGVDKAMETGKVVDLAPLWKKAGYPLD